MHCLISKVAPTNSTVLILGETFGWFEAGGAAFIISAALVEVVWTRPVEKADVAG